MFNWIKNLFSTYEKPKNSGVLIDPINRPEDYIVGANSPIPYKERLKTGDWTPYAFDQEKQYSDPSNGGLGDSMSCVSHSVINAIQAQEFFLTGVKKNYSKRWIAKMSGTTKEGNYLYKVADTIREYGLVSEEDYPAPKTPWRWEGYHAEIPKDKLEELKKKGEEWKKKWTFRYEFLQVNDKNIDYHLKHSPLQIVIPGHAVTGIYSPDYFITYLDSYPQWFKKYASDSLLSVMKPILTPNQIMIRKIKFSDSPEVWHVIPDDSMESMLAFDIHLPEAAQAITGQGYGADTKIYPINAKKPKFDE